MTSPPHLLALLAPLTALACTSGAAARRAEPAAAASAAPAPPTGAAAWRCATDGCACRDAAAEKGAPAAGAATTRYELRVGPTADPVWLELDGQLLLEKEPARLEEACVYVDLARGSHPLRLRTTAAPGSAGLTHQLRIAEFAPAGPYWYDLFDQRCGQGMPCSPEQLGAWRDEQQRRPRGVIDPCASARIAGVGWQGQRAPGGAVYERLEARVTLQVYEARSGRPPGDPGCSAL